MSMQPDVVAQYSDPSRPMVFHDGGCPLCRREIAHYRSIDSTVARLRWVDALSEPETLVIHALSLESAVARPVRRIEGADKFKSSPSRDLV